LHAVHHTIAANNGKAIAAGDSQGAEPIIMNIGVAG
jgi:hypothetical protein